MTGLKNGELPSKPVGRHSAPRSKIPLSSAVVGKVTFPLLHPATFPSYMLYFPGAHQAYSFLLVALHIP